MTSADRLAAMETGLRERLHLLVDALPVGDLPAAERYLEFLSGHAHPFVRALMDAPGDPEPLSDADRNALDEGRRALKECDTVSDRDLRTELGI